MSRMFELGNCVHRRGPQAGVERTSIAWTIQRRGVFEAEDYLGHLRAGTRVGRRILGLIKNKPNLRLEIKDLTPQEFNRVLKWLSEQEPARADKIFKEIEERLLQRKNLPVTLTITACRNPLDPISGEALVLKKGRTVSARYLIAAK